MEQNTFWKAGDKVVARFVPEEVCTVVSAELSDEPYFENGLSQKKTKPKYPIEWVKVRRPDGTIHEYAGHQLVKGGP